MCIAVERAELTFPPETNTATDTVAIWVTVAVDTPWVVLSAVTGGRTLVYPLTEQYAITVSFASFASP